MFAARTGWPLEENPLTRAARERRARGGLLDLTQSNPTQCGFDYGDLGNDLNQPAVAVYDPQPRGLAAARAAVAGYYAARGVQAGAEDFLLTAGTSEAYAHLFRLLCEPGAEVLAPAPSYPLFDLLADLADIRLRAYPSFYDHGWHLDWAQLEAAAGPRTRALLLVHPNNPTGAYLAAADWARMQAFAAARGLAVIVDEVFFDYPGEAAAVSLDYAGAGALTLVLNGLSKLAALPQMKLAWIGVFGPRALAAAAQARLEVINDTFLSASTPVQLAAVGWIARRQAMQRQIRARVAANLSTLDRLLAGAPGVRRLAPQGGWSAILRLPATQSDEGWALTLLERCGVLLHPGHFYELGGGGEAHLVASLLGPPGEFEQGLKLSLSCVN